MDFVSAIIQHLRTNVVTGPGDTIMKFGGNPGIAGYPFLTVNSFNWTNQVFNTKEYFQETATFQTTIATFDPAQSDRIGEAARLALMPANQLYPRIEFDNGHEVLRLPGEARKWEQPGVGPGSRTVFYYGFDTVMYLQKSLISA